MELRLLTDDELFAHIASVDDGGGRREEVEGALEELFRRLREQAPPEGARDVERVIRFVRSAFADDEDEGPGSVGVREPRRPSPHPGSTGACAPVSDAA